MSFSAYWTIFNAEISKYDISKTLDANLFQQNVIPFLFFLFFQKKR